MLFYNRCKKCKNVIEKELKYCEFCNTEQEEQVVNKKPYVKQELSSFFNRICDNDKDSNTAYIDVDVPTTHETSCNNDYSSNDFSVDLD